MTNFILSFTGPITYAVLLGVLILCGMGNPFPEDTALIAGGYLSYLDVINPYVTVAICYIGVLTGDVMLYWFGRRYGQHIIEHKRFLRLIPVERVDRIRQSFKRWGHWTVFFARFLIGLRTPTFIVSGVMHLPFRKFLLLDGLGALLSVPLFIGLGYLFGNNIDVLSRDVRRVEHWVMAFFVVIVACWFVVWWWRSRREENG